MSTRVAITGAAFVIDGDTNTDTIIKSRHCTTADPATLAPHCLAELGGAVPFRGGGTYPIVLCRGTFGIGSARIQAPLALAGAGVRAVVAPAFAPIFFENCINGAILFPLAATLADWPQTGERLALTLADGKLTIARGPTVESHPCSLPDWALAGTSWLDVIERQAADAGGLDALRATFARTGKSAIRRSTTDC